MDRSLRLQIAEQQIKIKELKADLAEAEASVEQATIAAAGGFKGIEGAEKERAKVLALAVADSPACRKYRRDIITAEGTLLRLEAAHGDQQDDAQRERWRVRSRLCDALEALGMAQPAGFFSSGEIDRAVDEASGEVLYNTGRHAVVLRRTDGSNAPAIKVIDAAVNAEVTPRGRTGAQIYRAEAARRERTKADIEADELFS